MTEWYSHSASLIHQLILMLVGIYPSMLSFSWMRLYLFSNIRISLIVLFDGRQASFFRLTFTNNYLTLVYSCYHHLFLFCYSNKDTVLVAFLTSHIVSLTLRMH